MFFAIIATTCGLPRINEEQQQKGLGTENVAASILKAKFNTRENVVFSPFGYSSILAMLGEGAKGATHQEIRDFLRLSDDTKQIRDTFRSLMARYGGDEPTLVPQFKTWFYVYENNTVNEDFVKTLREDYLVEIKTIKRNFYDFDEPASGEVQVSDMPEKVVLAEPEVVLVGKESASKNIPGIEDDSENLFDDVDLDGNGKNLPVEDIDAILKQKECSRFDEEVDDQQYVESTQALREGGVVAAPSNSGAAAEDNETVHPIEKESELKKIVKIDDNAETLKMMDEEMGVLAVARKNPVTKKFQAAGRALEEINDVSTALSGNSLMGRKQEDSLDEESKMLLFNGLYFRGRWKTPFQVSLNDECLLVALVTLLPHFLPCNLQRLRSEVGPGNVFYLQDEAEPVEVAMMRSRGEFKTGFSDAFKAQIIELPYEVGS